MEDSLASGQRRGPRPPRRPEQQQIMLRRGLALGAGLLVLILAVLGVRGCLDARKDRALRDYASDVTQIVNETAQTGKRFFGKLNEPGGLSVTDFVADVEADRSAIDNYSARVESLDTPGDMSEAQGALELSYELRRDAMATIANRMSTALGDAGAEKATEAIAGEIRKLLASDVVYASVVRPDVNGVLADRGLEGDDVPPSVFVPDEKWIDSGEVGSALASVSGSSGGAPTPGVHGLGLEGTSVNGTELVPEGVTPVVAEGAPEVEVAVQNQGESTENGVTVSVSANGENLTQDIPEIAPGETATATIGLASTPKGEVTLEVVAEPVPGEKVPDNNEATYTVVFE